MAHVAFQGLLKRICSNYLDLFQIWQGLAICDIGLIINNFNILWIIIEIRPQNATRAIYNCCRSCFSLAPDSQNDVFFFITCMGHKRTTSNETKDTNNTGRLKWAPQALRPLVSCILSLVSYKKNTEKASDLSSVLLHNTCCREDTASPAKGIWQKIIRFSRGTKKRVFW